MMKRYKITKTEQTETIRKLLHKTFKEDDFLEDDLDIGTYKPTELKLIERLSKLLK